MATVAGGGQISTGIGQTPENIQLTIIRNDGVASKVSVAVSQVFTSGTFVVRFTNVETGAEHFGEQTVHWIAW